MSIRGRKERFTEEELESLLSAYLDDELGEEEKLAFAEYLRIHPEAQRQLDALRNQAQLLRSKLTPPENPQFVAGVASRLVRRRPGSELLLPFPRKYLPLAAGTAAVLLVLTGVLLFRERLAVGQFFTEKQVQVREAYDQALAKADLLPLFSSVSTDQVLQFILFGTVPVNAEAKTALRVDRNSDSGYRIELARGAAIEHPTITAAEFYKELGATEVQHQEVDSILRRAAEKLQGSVFIGDSSLIAVHESLPRLNEVMMSEIASKLDNSQRVRFQKLLIRTHAPCTFAVAAVPNGKMPPAAAIRRDVPAPTTDRFLVITPDTLSVAVLQFNADSLLRVSAEISSSMRIVTERTHELMSEMARFRAVTRAERAPFTVSASPRDLRIEVSASLAPALPPSSVRILPRSSSDARELERSLSTLGEPLSRAPQGMYSPRRGGPIDLDSLLDRMRQFDSVRSSVKKPKIFLNPIEL